MRYVQLKYKSTFHYEIHQNDAGLHQDSDCDLGWEVGDQVQHK